MNRAWRLEGRDRPRRQERRGAGAVNEGPGGVPPVGVA